MPPPSAPRPFARGSVDRPPPRAASLPVPAPAPPTVPSSGRAGSHGCVHVHVKPPLLPSRPASPVSFQVEPGFGRVRPPAASQSSVRRFGQAATSVTATVFVLVEVGRAAGISANTTCDAAHYQRGRVERAWTATLHGWALRPPPRDQRD